MLMLMIVWRWLPRCQQPVDLSSPRQPSTGGGPAACVPLRDRGFRVVYPCGL